MISDTAAWETWMQFHDWHTHHLPMVPGQPHLLQCVTINWQWIYALASFGLTIDWDPTWFSCRSWHWRYMQDNMISASSSLHVCLHVSNHAPVQVFFKVTRRFSNFSSQVGAFHVTISWTMNPTDQRGEYLQNEFIVGVFHLQLSMAPLLIVAPTTLDTFLFIPLQWNRIFPNCGALVYSNFSIDLWH